MNGKQEPAKSTDRQCKHCGLWFDRRGHIPHQRNCDFQQYERTIIPLAGEGEGDTDEAVDGKDPTPTDGVGDGGTPDGSTPTNDPARTDGAGLGLEGPPESPTGTEDDDQEEIDDADETVDCPGCGEDTGATEKELQSFDDPRCSECGTGLVVR